MLFPPYPVSAASAAHPELSVHPSADRWNKPSLLFFRWSPSQMRSSCCNLLKEVKTAIWGFTKAAIFAFCKNAKVPFRRELSIHLKRLAALPHSSTKHSRHKIKIEFKFRRRINLIPNYLQRAPEKAHRAAAAREELPSLVARWGALTFNLSLKELNCGIKQIK